MGNYVCVDPRAQHRGLTATTMDDTHAFLTARILHDKQAVTYRLLSREMGMHVDEAKAALGRFAEAEDVSVIYAVHDVHHVFVVPASELESTLARLSNGKKQVYALQQWVHRTIQPCWPVSTELSCMTRPMLLSAMRVLAHLAPFKRTRRFELLLPRHLQTSDAKS